MPSLDPNRPDLRIGIVGAGVMGRGIAQVAAAAGITALIADAQAAAAAEARAFIARMFARAVEKGRMTAAAAASATARVEIVDDRLAAFADCPLVIEAIVEDLEAKRRLFAALEDAVADDAVLATNTSSLSVTAIAAACRRPERVAGFHFFNPVPLMKLVEVVGGVRTASWALDALEGLARRFGHRPVRAADMPGFLVNHAGRGFVTEALAIVGEGVASHADVDRVLCEAAGFRMGPFALMDLTGLDVSHPVMESIWAQFYGEPRFRPSPLAARRAAAGLFGRKTGRGFYDYDEGGRILAPPAPPVPDAAPLPVWVAPAEAELRDPLVAVLRRCGAEIRETAEPPTDGVLIVAPLGEDATGAAVAHGLDARRTVAVDPLFGLDARRSLMATPATERAARDAAHALLARDGTPVTLLCDSPGFVAQRVVAMIINIGCEIAQKGIARPGDIDSAARIGLGYPKGPLEWGDAIGPRRVLAILEAMRRVTGDPRYRPSLWLKRRALLGVSLTQTED